MAHGAKGNISMKYYLGTFTIRDGEHEHMAYAVTRKRSYETATAWANRQLYDYGETRAECLWSFGDGDTACTAWDLTEITEDEFDVLSKYLFCDSKKSK